MSGTRSAHAAAFPRRGARLPSMRDVDRARPPSPTRPMSRAAAARRRARAPGTVGGEVVRAILERPDDADGRRAARARPSPGSPSATSTRPSRAGLPADLLTDAPAHLVAERRHRRRRRADGRRRAGPDADRGGARRGNAGRDREQARPRPPRRGARGDRPADRRGAPVRGGGRRRHPGPRAARARARRQPRHRRSGASSTARRTTSSPR